MRSKSAIFLFLLSLLIMSCAHYFRPTTGIGVRAEIEPHFGYVYGYFNAKGLSQLESDGKKSGWALEIKAIGKNKAVPGSIYIPFEFEPITDFGFKKQMNNEINSNKGQKTISPGEDIKVVKIPTGRYKFSNVIYACSSKEEPEKYKEKGKTKIAGLKCPDTLKITAGTFYYIGSWRTAEALHFDINMEEWNHEVYDFFTEETYYLIKQFPKAEKFEKYNVFTETVYEYPTAIVAALFSDYIAIREAAESTLIVMGKPAILPLVYLFKRDDPKMHIRIVKILEKIGKPAVEPLIQAISIDDKRCRQGAAEALGRIADRRAVDPLIAALNDKDASVRREAVAALGKIGDVRAANPLVVVLNDEDAQVRRNAAKELDKFHWKPATQQQRISYLIAKKNWDVLQSIGQQAVDSLINVLGDQKSFSIPAKATEVLENIGKPAVEPLIAALRAEDSNVRGRAAEALGNIGDIRAVEPLIVLLKDKTSNVRWKTAEGLDELNWKPETQNQTIFYLIAKQKWDALTSFSQSAVGALIGILEDENHDVRWGAEEALEEIGKPAVEPLIAILQNEDSNVRKEAVVVLGNIGDVRAVEPLIDALKNEDSDIRCKAAAALGDVGDPRAVEHLIEALKDEDDMVRYVVAREALRDIGKPAVVPLIVALKQKNFNVRSGAVDALGIIDDVRAVEPLITQLKDEHSDIRRKTAAALGNIGDPRAVESLIVALRDEDSGVRLEASTSLRRIAGENFRWDQKEWQEWWGRNKEKYHKKKY
ncbi:MAG: HEAT repeat domain-containing protein [Deltaproteobacteria bacterium]|nr:HEAT repeat domain-containing protein [Deltaproteobacteria bacterium]